MYTINIFNINISSDYDPNVDHQKNCTLIFFITSIFNQHLYFHNQHLYFHNNNINNNFSYLYA